MDVSRLTESLEEPSLLLWRHADARVFHGKTKTGSIFIGRHGFHAEGHAPRSGEFSAFPRGLMSNLAQAKRIAPPGHGARSKRVETTSSSPSSAARWGEQIRDALHDGVKQEGCGFQFQLSGLIFREARMSS